MPKKTEREDPLGVFNIHFVAKHQKIEGGKFLVSEKNFTVPKKLKGGTLWDFPTSILSQNSKNLKGDPLGKIFFPEKSLTMPKKLKGRLKRQAPTKNPKEQKKRRHRFELEQSGLKAKTAPLG